MGIDGIVQVIGAAANVGRQKHRDEPAPNTRGLPARLQMIVPTQHPAAPSLIITRQWTRHLWSAVASSAVGKSQKRSQIRRGPSSLRGARATSNSLKGPVLRANLSPASSSLALAPERLRPWNDGLVARPQQSWIRRVKGTD